MTKKTTKTTKKDGADGLGRPGTAAHFFRTAILARPNRTNADLVAEAKKRFPKVEIAPHWASWYRAEIVRRKIATRAAAYGAKA